MDIIKLLKAQAKEIAEAGHNGWGNTMLLAAEALASQKEQAETVDERAEFIKLAIEDEILCVDYNENKGGFSDYEARIAFKWFQIGRAQLTTAKPSTNSDAKKGELVVMLREWIEATGAIPLNGSWHAELEHMLIDAAINSEMG